MTVYTYSEARQRLASLLEQAAKGAEVRIRREDGRVLRDQTGGNRRIAARCSGCGARRHD